MRDAFAGAGRPAKAACRSLRPKTEVLNDLAPPVQFPSLELGNSVLVSCIGSQAFDATDFCLSGSSQARTIASRSFSTPPHAWQTELSPPTKGLPEHKVWVRLIIYALVQLTRGGSVSRRDSRRWRRQRRHTWYTIFAAKHTLQSARSSIAGYWEELAPGRRSPVCSPSSDVPTS